jgi:hypothetical protein
MSKLSGSMLDLVQATSGSIGAMISTSIVFPLDRFKARLQVGVPVSVLLKEIQTGGMANFVQLWRGARSRIIEQMCTKFTYFYFYSFIKVFVEKTFYNRKKLGTFANILVGYASAFLNNILTLPLQVTSTRVMVSKDKKTTQWKEGKIIVETEGFTGLWRGIAPSIILCINPAISFAAFDQFKLFVLRSRHLDVDSPLSAREAFIFGAIAKVVATLLTFPFIRVKTLMQVGGSLLGGKNMKSKVHEKKISNVTEVDHSKLPVSVLLKFILKSEGVGGLYTGLIPQLTKGVAASAVLFAAKEKIFEFTKKVVLSVAK